MISEDMLLIRLVEIEKRLTTIEEQLDNTMIRITQKQVIGIITAIISVIIGIKVV